MAFRSYNNTASPQSVKHTASENSMIHGIPARNVNMSPLNLFVESEGPTHDPGLPVNPVKDRLNKNAMSILIRSITRWPTQIRGKPVYELVTNSFDIDHGKSVVHMTSDAEDACRDPMMKKNFYFQLEAFLELNGWELRCICMSDDDDDSEWCIAALKKDDEDPLRAIMGLIHQPGQ